MTSEVLDLKRSLQIVGSDLHDILEVLDKIQKKIDEKMGMKSVGEGSRKKINLGVNGEYYLKAVKKSKPKPKKEK